jgi:CDP-6-deoxy-D-xylo-4-hexulose-3-dehydrase
MSEKKYPLATTTWDEQELDAMQEVIRSGRFTMGDRVKQAEARFADIAGSRYSVMVNSGSSANLLMVASLFFLSGRPLRRGDVVIVPAVSWSTTYAPLQQLGLKVRFVDIDPKTMNIDLAQLDGAVCENTRLIFSVNLLGNPVDYRALNQIASRHDLLVLEDNCESLGARLDDQWAGTFGVAGSFSSFFSHHISTMEGGFVVTDSEELYHVMLSVREHGWTRSLPERNLVTGAKSDDWFEESFRFVLPGFNLRPLELSGALAVEQIKKIPSLIRGRRENGKRFQEIATGFNRLSIQEETGDSSWFGFALVCNDPDVFPRKRLRNTLDCLGFEYRPIVAGNFTRNPVLKWFDVAECDVGTFPNADYIHDHGLFIGNHHYPMRDALDVLSKIEGSI